MRRFGWIILLIWPMLSAQGADILLTWTATGDDGTLGTASAYDLRYSLNPITASNFDSCTQCMGVPIPQVSGSSESFQVEDLAPNTTYYFALKSRDEAYNWSTISNVWMGTTEDENSSAKVPILHSK